jgi:hypothetical protein
MPPLVVIIPALLGLLAVAVLYAAIRRKRESTGPEFPLAAEALIPAAAQKAVARARARFNIALDYSVPSIHQLDDIFDRFREVRASSPEITDPNSLAFVFGAYLGETIRLNHAGFGWERESAAVDFQLHGKNAVYSPIDWCMKRLTEADAETLWQCYEAIVGTTPKTRAASAS